MLERSLKGADQVPELLEPGPVHFLLSTCLDKVTRAERTLGVQRQNEIMVKVLNVQK